MSPKPGWTTSEWWLTLVFVGAMSVAAIGALDLGSAYCLSKVGASLAAALVVAGYQLSRARVKSG